MTLKTYPIRGPYKGVVTDFPPPADSQAFDDVVNFFMRKGRIQTRPRFNNVTAPPDGAALRLDITFEDAVNLFHTLVLTTQNAYFLTSGPVYNALTYPAGISGLGGTALPYGWQQLLSRVYFTNGSVPLLYADGESSLKVAGDVQGAGRFLSQNVETLIMAYTTEPAPGNVNSTEYQNRVRWCAAGDPSEWDPTNDVTAGFNDLVEVPDAITGLSTLGRNTYVFHTAGCVVMFPSPGGQSAFAFEDFILGSKGCGNSYPYALDTYGGTCVFIAENELYTFDGSTLNPIGLGNKKAIYKDLEQNSGDVVFGKIVPGMGAGYDFLSYWLTIPGPNVTWVYSYDDRNWVRFSSSAGYISGMNLVSVA